MKDYDAIMGWMDDKKERESKQIAWNWHVYSIGITTAGTRVKNVFTHVMLSKNMEKKWFVFMVYLFDSRGIEFSLDLDHYFAGTKSNTLKYFVENSECQKEHG